MRYESFYPFARQQPSPPPTGHSGFGLPPQMGQRQAPRQPFPNGPMNNPFGGPDQVKIRNKVLPKWTPICRRQTVF